MIISMELKKGLKFTQKIFYFFLFLLQKMEQDKCEKNAISHKKLQIKNVTDDFK